MNSKRPPWLGPNRAKLRIRRSQSGKPVTFHGRDIAAPAGFSAFGAKQMPASRRLSVPFQLLRQIGRHVGEDDRVVTVVAQFQYVTDPVNLGDQRALVCGDAEPGAQSP